MGGQAKNPTPARPIRIPEERWNLFGKQVGDRRRAEAVNEFIAWANHEPGAKMPKRPPAPPAADA